MEKNNQRKILIRNAFLLVILFAAVIFFRWNCLLEGGSRFAGIQEETTEEIVEFIEETPKYMVGISINGETYSTGVIVGFTEKIFILTDYESVSKAESIRIVFTDGSEYPAIVEKVDIESCVAMISVLKSEVDVETRKILSKAEFGNSDSLAKGDRIALIGNKITYGKISDMGEKIQALDSEYRIISTDISYVGEGGAFIFNSNGEIVGMLQSLRYNKGYGISDLINIVNRFSNDYYITYMGIYGEANPETSEGVYITRVVENSPAWKAGIRQGDTVLFVESKKANSMKDIQIELEKKNKDDELILETKNLGVITIILGGR